jgi:hypothetical protein
MNLERYPYFHHNDFRSYEFYSYGPKGRIHKMVTFTCIPHTDPPVYNLAFGDLNPESGEVDDRKNSNNQDKDIVLATVASTIAKFCDHHGDHYIYAEGSTPSRTRLYQMGIAEFWQEISMDFEVYGLIADVWKPFIPHTVNYEAFLVKRK